MVSFGKALKALRTSKGMSINQLAMYSKISSASISRYESEERGAPKPENIKKLATALKVRYEELMEMAGHLEHQHPENKRIEFTEDHRSEIHKIDESKKTNFILNELVKKYNLDLSIPGEKERLEQFIKLYSETRKQQ